MINVAYIDDCSADRFIFAKMFENFAYTVVVNLFESVFEIEGEYDIIFTDMNMMSGGYGVEVIDKIRAKYPDVILIGLSGLEGEHLARSYIDHGLDGFLHKNNLFKASDFITEYGGGQR